MYLNSDLKSDVDLDMSSINMCGFIKCTCIPNIKSISLLVNKRAMMAMDLSPEKTSTKCLRPFLIKIIIIITNVLTTFYED